MAADQNEGDTVNEPVDNGGGNQVDNSGAHHVDGSKYRDEVFARRVPAGKRTYFFDVKTTRSGEDFFITITESKRVDEHRYEKHKIFLYKEDFGKFVAAMHDVVRHVKAELLPEYDFRGLPELPPALAEEEHHRRDHDGF